MKKISTSTKLLIALSLILVVLSTASVFITEQINVFGEEGYDGDGEAFGGTQSSGIFKLPMGSTADPDPTEVNLALSSPVFYITLDDGTFDNGLVTSIAKTGVTGTPLGYIGNIDVDSNILEVRTAKNSKNDIKTLYSGYGFTSDFLIKLSNEVYGEDNRFIDATGKLTYEGQYLMLQGEANIDSTGKKINVADTEAWQEFNTNTNAAKSGLFNAYGYRTLGYAKDGQTVIFVPNASVRAIAGGDANNNGIGVDENSLASESSYNLLKSMKKKLHVLYTTGPQEYYVERIAVDGADDIMYSHAVNFNFMAVNKSSSIISDAPENIDELQFGLQQMFGTDNGSVYIDMISECFDLNTGNLKDEKTISDVIEQSKRYDNALKRAEYLWSYICNVELLSNGDPAKMDTGYAGTTGETDYIGMKDNISPADRINAYINMDTYDNMDSSVESYLRSIDIYIALYTMANYTGDSAITGTGDCWIEAIGRYIDAHDTGKIPYGCNYQISTGAVIVNVYDKLVDGVGLKRYDLYTMSYADAIGFSSGFSSKITLAKSLGAQAISRWANEAAVTGSLAVTSSDGVSTIISKSGAGMYLIGNRATRYNEGINNSSDNYYSIGRKMHIMYVAGRYASNNNDDDTAHSAAQRMVVIGSPIYSRRILINLNPWRNSNFYDWSMQQAIARSSASSVEYSFTTSGSQGNNVAMGTDSLKINIARTFNSCYYPRAIDNPGYLGEDTAMRTLLYIDIPKINAKNWKLNTDGYNRAEGTNVYIAGNHYNVPEFTNKAAILADVVVGFDNAEANAAKVDGDELTYIKHTTDANADSAADEKLNIGINFRFFNGDGVKSFANISALESSKDKIKFYLKVTAVGMTNANNNSSDYGFWTVTQNDILVGKKDNGVKNLERALSNISDKVNYLTLYDGKRIENTTQSKNTYAYEISCTDMIKYLKQDNIDSDASFSLKLADLDISGCPLTLEALYSMTYRIELFQVDIEEDIAANEKNTSFKMWSLLAESEDDDKSLTGDCIKTTVELAADDMDDKQKLEFGKYAINTINTTINRSAYMIVTGATSKIRESYTEGGEESDYALKATGDSTKDIRNNHCYFSVGKIAYPVDGYSGNVKATGELKYSSNGTHEMILTLENESAQKAIGSKAVATFNIEYIGEQTIDEVLKDMYETKAYKNVGITFTTGTTGKVVYSDGTSEYVNSTYGTAALKYGIDSYISNVSTGVEGGVLSLTKEEVKTLLTEGKLPSKYSFYIDEWATQLIGDKNVSNSVLKSISRVEITVNINIYGFKSTVNLNGKSTIDKYTNYKDIFGTIKVGYGAVTSWTNTSHKTHGMYLIAGCEIPAAVVPELATYRSIPLTYAEIKEGTIGITGTGSIENYDAMAGVPSTEKLYFSTGGSEFIVEITVGEVYDEETTRTYTSFFRSRTTGCKFMVGDSLSGGGGTVTTKTLQYANNLVNNNTKTSSVKEWYNLPNPTGASTFNTNINSDHTKSSTITATWKGTITNTTANPGVSDKKSPEDKISSDGTHYSGKPGSMIASGQENSGGYSWSVAEYNTALKNAQKWGEKLEEISDGIGNVIKTANSDGETRSWHVGDAVIAISFTNVNSVTNSNAYHTLGHLSSLSATTVNTNNYTDLLLTSNDARLSSGWFEDYGHAEDISVNSCKGGSSSATGQKREDEMFTWNDELELAEFVPSTVTRDVKNNGGSWLIDCIINPSSCTATWNDPGKTTVSWETKWCGFDCGSVLKDASGHSFTPCTTEKVVDEEEVLEVSHMELDYDEDGKLIGSHKVVDVPYEAEVSHLVGNGDHKFKLDSGANQTPASHTCTATHSTSNWKETTTKQAPNLGFTITVTFKNSYTDGKDGEIVTPNGQLPAHALCGPCCMHTTMPAIYDKWQQNLKYSYIQITDVNVLKISRSYVDGMNKITFTETDNIIANVENGDPNIFYNIAAMNTVYANSPQTAKKEASLSGRLRYTLQAQQHDAVTWDEKNPTTLENLRTTDCDGQGSTQSEYNPCKVTKGGHNNDWARGILYSRGATGTFTSDEEWLDSIGGVANKASYTKGSLDEIDVNTVEYKRFKSRRETKNTAYVISDMLILQTSTGDNSILYYTMKETLTAQEHYDNGAFNCTLADAWYNNTLAAGSTGGKQTLIENSSNINVGGYTGRWYNTANKYSGSTIKTISTIFDSGSVADATVTQLDNLATVPAAKNYGTVANTTDLLNDYWYKSSPCWFNKSGINQYGQKRMSRVTHFKTLEDEVQINPIIENDDYMTGKAYQSYINILEYKMTPENTTHNAYNGATDAVEFKYTTTEDDILGYKCYKQEAFYYGNTKVNNIIIHTPVSNSGSMIASLGNERDQRTNAPKTGSLVDDDSLNYCPGTPALCDYRYLDCKYLQDTVLYSTDFENSATVADGFDTNGNVKTKTINTVYTDDEGGVYVRDKIALLESKLTDGFTIDTNNVFGTGNSLRCYGTRWSIKLNDLKYSYDKCGKIQVDMDYYMPSIQSYGTMIVSFNSYDWYIPSGQTYGCWNTGNGWEKKCNTSLVGTKLKLRFVFDMSNLNESELYINGTKVTNYTIVNSSGVIDSERIGATINIGSWNLDGDYPACFYIDNLVITRPAGSTTHTDECYVTTYKCSTTKNYTCTVPVTFESSTSIQTFTAPQNGTYRFDAYTKANGSTLGNMTTGEVDLAKGQTVYISVDPNTGNTTVSYTSDGGQLYKWRIGGNITWDNTEQAYKAVGQSSMYLKPEYSYAINPSNTYTIKVTAKVQNYSSRYLYWGGERLNASYGHLEGIGGTFDYSATRGGRDTGNTEWVEYTVTKTGTGWAYEGWSTDTVYYALGGLLNRKDGSANTSQVTLVKNIELYENGVLVQSFASGSTDNLIVAAYKSGATSSILSIPGLVTKKLTDGSTWARVLYQDISANTNYFNSSNMMSVNQPGLFSCLGRLAEFKSGDKYEFMLTYPDATGAFKDKYNRWRQTNSPFDEKTNSGPQTDYDVTGYEAIHVDLPGYSGHGLEYNGNSCIFDGTVSFGNWWLCCGIMNSSYCASSNSAYGMPGPHNGSSRQGAAQCELWVRVNDLGLAGSTTQNASSYSNVSSNNGKVVVTLTHHNEHNDDCSYEMSELNSHTHTAACIGSDNDYLITALNAAYNKQYTLLNKVLGSNIYSITTSHIKLYDTHIHGTGCVFTPTQYNVTHKVVHSHDSSCYTTTSIAGQTFNGGYRAGGDAYNTWYEDNGAPQRMYAGNNNITFTTSYDGYSGGNVINMSVRASNYTCQQSYKNFKIVINGTAYTVNEAKTLGLISDVSRSGNDYDPYSKHPYPDNILNGGDTGVGEWQRLAIQFKLLSGKLTGVQIYCSHMTRLGDGFAVSGNVRTLTCTKSTEESTVTHISTSRTKCSVCGSELITKAEAYGTAGTWSCGNAPLNGFATLASTVVKSTAHTENKTYQTTTTQASVDSKTFNASTSVQSFVAPATGTYTLEAYGAQGGGAAGGKGGYAKSIVTLTANKTYYVVAGTMGASSYKGIDSGSGYFGGGYFGGGSGCGAGSGGGGLSGVFTSSTPTQAGSLVVAGGGGAASSDYYNSYAQTPSSTGSMYGGSGYFGWTGSYWYDMGGGGGGYYGGNTVGGDDPCYGYAGTNYSTGSGSTNSYGQNTGNGKVVISWNITQQVVTNKNYTYTYYTYTGSAYTAPGEINETHTEFNADGWQDVLNCLNGTTAGVSNAINKIKARFNEIPLYVDDSLNPILSCYNQNDVHIHTAECFVPITKLVCDEPHHSGLHYDYTNSTCYSACHNDANHVKNETVVTGATGETYTQGEYINLDYGFKIYYPNYGDFKGTIDAGFSTLQSERGRGYTSFMDTTRWVRQKSVRFNFDVLFYNEVTGLWEQHKAQEWINLPVVVAGAVRDWSKDQSAIAITEYSFYCLLSNNEVKSTTVEFNTEAINRNQYEIDKADVYKDTGSTVVIQNPNSNNAERNGYSYESFEDSYRVNTIDIVGRIGNMLIIDTDDLRFCNFFKKVVDGEWLIEPIIAAVDESEQTRYISVGDNDVRGEAVSTTNEAKFNTYNTQSWTASSIPYVKSIVSGSISNIKQLSNDELKPGYNILMEVTTIGQYKGLEIAPYFYAYDTVNKNVIPVDVWYAENDTISAINIYGLLDNPYYTNLLRAKNQSSITDSVWSAYKENGLSNYLLTLDWINEKARRNVSILEEQLTSNVSQTYGEWLQIGEPDIYGIYESYKFSPGIAPYGTNYTLGTLQLLTPGERARTNIGKSETMTELFNGGHSTNFENLVDEILFTKNAQRWHLKLGLPSSSIFVPYSAAYKGDNSTAIHLNPLEFQKDGTKNSEILKEKKADGSNRYVILIGIDTIANGDVWYLNYEGYKGPQVIKVNGEDVTLDTNIKDIIAVYDAVDQSIIDVTITGTH